MSLRAFIRDKIEKEFEHAISKLEYVVLVGSYVDVYRDPDEGESGVFLTALADLTLVPGSPEEDKRSEIICDRLRDQDAGVMCDAVMAWDRLSLGTHSSKAMSALEECAKRMENKSGGPAGIVRFVWERAAHAALIL